MKKTMSFLGVAGCVLAAGSLCATSVTNTFDDAVGTWLGDCAKSTTESNYTFSAAAIAGFPTGKTSPLSGNYVLTVEGVATNAVSGGTTPLVDMMVQAARPDEELEIPEEDAGHVSIAVAVDSEGYFNAYCTTNSSAAGWVKISTTPADEDAWVRVSLLFDSGYCQIRINGEPMMSQAGYLTKEGTTAGGAWYELANSGVSTVKVAGCTAIDEFVYNETASSYPLVAGATNDVGISCAWLDQYGLAWDKSGESYDSSKKADGTTAMTVADKYKYCFSPFDGKGEADFAVKSISTTADNVTLILPETVETAGRKVVVDYGTDKNFGSFDTTEVTGQGSVQVTAPAPGNVTYYRLRATDK